MSVGAGVSLRGEVPRALIAAILVLPVVLGALWWALNRPVPPIELAECTSPEAVIIPIDDSDSVQEVDQNDERGRAVSETLRLLAASPCTDDDVVAVVSFTDTIATTGPAPISELGAIRRLNGGGTDIPQAINMVRSIAAQYPGHRIVVVLLSDLQDGTAIPVDQTLSTLDDFETVVVSIGNVDGADFQLDNGTDISRSMVDVINNSRKAQP